MTGEASVRALAAELRDMETAGGAVLAVRPLEAFSLLACLQLAWRHPGLSPDQKGIIERFGRQLQALFDEYPTAAALAEHGWDPTKDVPR